MLLAVLVIGGAAPLQDLSQARGIQRLLDVEREQGLGQAQHVAAVAVSHRLEGFARLWRDRQGMRLEPLGAFQQDLQRRVVQPFQHIDLAARQQRPV